MKIRCVTALVIAAAGPLAGQAPVPWTLSGSPSLFVARQQIATSDQLSGALLGAELAGEWRGAVMLALRGYVGTVRSASAVVARHVRLTDAALAVRPRSWLALGVEAEALRSEEPGDTAVWRMAGPLVQVSTGLGLTGLTAQMDVAYFPLLGVAGLDSLALAARLQVGMAYTPPRLPVTVQIAYRRETFSFTDTRAPEALGGLVLSARAHLLPR